MRSHPADYELVAPGSLPAVLSVLASQPGQWLPIAGGTDVMVQYGSGKLQARKLISIWNLPELRRIEVLPNELRIGAGCTYTDLRGHAIVGGEFPLLASAARWTGGIANQNRGTIGGNIVNASPAADSLPALLVYKAELILASVRGERRVPYSSFHTGYRKTNLASDELVRAVVLQRRFSEHFAYTRKIGARNAQAISKVCMAALGRIAEGSVSDVRIAMGSVAPVPLRLTKTERLLMGQRIDATLIAAARASTAAEIRPIDDVRSTARYRAAVAGNLVAEFLNQLSAVETKRANSGMGDVLARWNRVQPHAASEDILPCCGSKAWARGMADRRPIFDEATLLTACNEVWWALDEADWNEAFSSHPKIGEATPAQPMSARSAQWSGEEQRSVANADDSLTTMLAEGNRRYEDRFRRIFIVCATGRTPHEILAILERRLQNDEATELREAAEQQRQIAHIRLKKWLSA
jgi:OHCU decarboxylase